MSQLPGRESAWHAVLRSVCMVAAGPLRSRLHAAAARGLTRFVGRDTKLEQLRLMLGPAGAGRGQVVAIVGEPGVGESRLVWEVTHSHRTHGWLIIQAGPNEPQSRPKAGPSVEA